MILGIGFVGGVSINPNILRIDARIAGTPDTPVRRQVAIYRDNADGHAAAPALAPSTLTLFGIVWTGADGLRTVRNVNAGHTYTAIAYDHTGVHDPVIKAGLVPEVPE